MARTVVSSEIARRLLSGLEPTLSTDYYQRARTRLPLLRTHAKDPHQLIEHQPQIANVFGLPVQCLLIRADDAADQQY